MSIAGSPGPHGAWTPGGHIPEPSVPEDSPSIGIKLNHFCVRIRDPNPTLHFYVNLMGMRTIFTMNVGPWTIYYLGFPNTSAHRADPKAFSLETAAKLSHTLGLLELYHIHGTKSDPNFPGYSTGNTPPNLGLCHFGFTVPDVESTVERLRKEGVEVVKELGVCTRRSIPISEWEEQRGYAGGEDIANRYKAIFEQIAFVKDPVSRPDMIVRLEMS